jgi:hypothetical protein
MTVEEDFRALREHDALHAPPFEAMRVRQAPHRRSAVVVVLPAAALAAAAVIVLWVSTRAQPPLAARNVEPARPTIADPEPLAFLMDPALETDTLRGGP